MESVDGSAAGSSVDSSAGGAVSCERISLLSVPRYAESFTSVTGLGDDEPEAGDGLVAGSSGLESQNHPVAQVSTVSRKS